MYSIKNLLDLNYWFSEPQPLNSLSLWIMLGVFMAMAIAAIVVWFVKNKKEDRLLARGLKKNVSLLVWMGGLGLMLLFFRYESAYFLSRRFWLGAWFLGLVVWVAFIARYFMVIMPKLKITQAEQEKLKKYLPR